jgi:hypothetical protein
MSRKRGGRSRARGGGGSGSGSGSGSGMMSSMRGGFKSAVRGATGSGKPGGKESPTRRFLWNLVTIALAVAAAVMLLKRFGVLR